jgi:D-alanyl-D-alanine carboxypeptidase (penicillin-binding protein 5/6)
LSRGPSFRSLYSPVSRPLDTRYVRLALALVFVVQCGMGVAWAQEKPTAGAARHDAAEEVPQQVPQPEVAARAWALVDAPSGEYLAGENASARLPTASTTKIMVALVAFQEANLDEEITVSEEAAAFANPIYSNVGLVAGDVLSVRELLMAALISSGDDATYALAEHLGGGSVEDFVEKMNREAEALGLRDTRFENPVGLDARTHYSSARDLAQMARLAMRYPEFREMVGTTYASIFTRYREIPLTNTNEMLFVYPPATGVKTGTTPAAGPSLVASAAAGDESYVSVVLDAREDRFAASVRTLEHAFDTYDRADLVVEGKRYAETDVPYRRGEKVGLVAKASVEGLVDASSNVEREVRLIEEPPGSARPGTKLGEVVVKVDGERVGESALLASRGYDEASLKERVWYTVGGLFE